jgi:hypothetical protein
MWARFSALKQSDQLRAIGWLVLACGLIGAAVFYLVESRASEPQLDDQTALGLTRALQHQIGALMGHFGLILSDWQNVLMSPAGEAVMIAIGAALAAGYFFRVAWVLDQEEGE